MVNLEHWYRVTFQMSLAITMQNTHSGGGGRVTAPPRFCPPFRSLLTRILSLFGEFFSLLSSLLFCSREINNSSEAYEKQR